MTMNKRYALGLDYGTNSCRSLLVDLETGEELGSAVFPYPGGEQGILTDSRDPNVARQNPRDYLDGLIAVISGALEQGRKADKNFRAESVVGIGVDTTGSTPLPVDKTGTPLAFADDFKDELAAQAWLWKDHTAHEEAAEITALAAQLHPEYLARCGGTYSSEWFWSKILRLKRVAPKVFAAAHSFVEHCDWIPAVLSGNADPVRMARSVCAAGHKAMFNSGWGGLPSRDFLAKLDPGLATLRGRLFSRASTSDQLAGRLSPGWAKKLKLKPGTAIAVGGFDAHMGAVGAGIKEGTLVKILGTSTCDLMIHPNQQPLADVPGLCGIVDGSVLPGYYGLEAGQSAVGDIFLWFVNNLVPDSYGATPAAKFENMERALTALKPGETGLLALDWSNGNRTILTDVRLSGLLLGQTLHTRPHEIYRALIEATAFGALTIVNRFEEYGVKVEEIINTGGLAVKNAALMQIYADVLGRPMKVSRSEQTCALGAAIFGAMAAGSVDSGFDSVPDAQRALCRVRETIFEPDRRRHATYTRLYGLYRQLHDAFGTATWSGRINHVMKELIALREEQRME
jgi:L-ribulokinase